jgi:hypothetical protein
MTQNALSGHRERFKDSRGNLKMLLWDAFNSPNVPNNSSFARFVSVIAKRWLSLPALGQRQIAFIAAIDSQSVIYLIF